MLFARCWRSIASSTGSFASDSRRRTEPDVTGLTPIPNQRESALVWTHQPSGVSRIMPGAMVSLLRHELRSSPRRSMSIRSLSLKAQPVALLATRSTVTGTSRVVIKSPKTTQCLPACCRRGHLAKLQLANVDIEQELIVGIGGPWLDGFRRGDGHRGRGDAAGAKRQQHEGVAQPVEAARHCWNPAPLAYLAKHRVRLGDDVRTVVEGFDIFDVTGPRGSP